jgi:hypothetical protein
LIVGWQKFYDDAVAQEKSASPDVVLLGQAAGVPGQQGWNTVGGKPPAKGANPWGSQNRKSRRLSEIIVSLLIAGLPFGG